METLPPRVVGWVEEEDLASTKDWMATCKEGGLGLGGCLCSFLGEDELQLLGWHGQRLAVLLLLLFVLRGAG
jgi:hypothetical protein